MPVQQYLKYITVTLIALGFSLVIGVLITSVLLPGRLPLAGLELQDGARETLLQGERVNILIMGNDARSGENISRSDSIVLASIDPRLEKAVLLFIPRDTRWESSRHGTQKINAALALDGPGASVEAVQELLDIQVDYYIIINFEAFTSIIDALGGIEIDVQESMHKASEGIHIERGLQVLDGRNALGYVRYRDYPMGDVERDCHQEIFIQALAEKLLSAEVLDRLPELILELNDLLVTDMLTTEMIRYAAWAPAFSPDSIITQTMPGHFENEYDDSGQLASCYWIVSEEEAGTILEDLYAGRRFDIY